MGVAIGFGSNLTHLFWLMSANRDAHSGAEKIRVVKRIDDRLSVPAYGIGVSCGIAMWLWTWPLNSSWVIASLALTVVAMVMGIAFSPFMHRWTKIAGECPPGEEPRATLSRWLTLWWAGITGSVVVVLYLMVWKPVLW